jgi:hypothetical protein
MKIQQLNNERRTDRRTEMTKLYTPFSKATQVKNFIFIFEDQI